jgi:hypothetical protein
VVVCVSVGWGGVGWGVGGTIMLSMLVISE